MNYIYFIPELVQWSIFLQQQSLAVSSQKNLITICAMYLRFVHQFELVFTSLMVQQLCLFIAWLSKRMKSPKTVQNYTLGLKTILELVYLDTQVFQLAVIKRTLKGCSTFVGVLFIFVSLQFGVTETSKPFSGCVA